MEARAIKDEILKSHMKRNLSEYGNCLIPESFAKKHGAKIIEEVKALGYPNAYLEVLPKIENIKKRYIIQTVEINREVKIVKRKGKK